MTDLPLRLFVFSVRSSLDKIRTWQPIVRVLTKDLFVDFLMCGVQKEESFEEALSRCKNPFFETEDILSLVKDIERPKAFNLVLFAAYDNYDEKLAVIINSLDCGLRPRSLSM